MTRGPGTTTRCLMSESGLREMQATSVPFTRSEREGDICRPSGFESSPQYADAQARVVRPFAQGAGLSVKRQSPVISTIVSLLRTGRPSTIRRLVVAVRIDAIQRMLRRWTSPHVRQEGIKRLAPWRADGDAAATVQRVRLLARKPAARFHRSPDTVLYGSCAAVPTVADARHLHLETTTGPRCALAKRVVAHVPKGTATAPTAPVGTRVVKNWSQDGPAIKRAPSQIRTRMTHNSVFSACPVTTGKGKSQ